MEIVLDRLGLTFDVAVAREDGPAKPDPESIRAICRRLGADPARAVCVGDWLFDVQAANAAGAVSVLVARGRRLDWADQADIVIDTLDELEPILEL
jgi:phosphoglycolate phosphatase-like HAD superfamily hydrolase